MSSQRLHTGKSIDPFVKLFLFDKRNHLIWSYIRVSVQTVSGSGVAFLVYNYYLALRNVAFLQHYDMTSKNFLQTRREETTKTPE